MEFKQQYAAYQQAIEQYLEGLFSQDKPYGRLQEAMRYSILGGGKRIRPVLTLEFARLGASTGTNRAGVTIFHAGVGALGGQPHGEKQLVVLSVVQRTQGVRVQLFQRVYDGGDLRLRLHTTSPHGYCIRCCRKGNPCYNDINMIRGGVSPCGHWQTRYGHRHWTRYAGSAICWGRVRCCAGLSRTARTPT